MKTTKSIFGITTDGTFQTQEIAVNKGVDRLKTCINHLSPLPALIAALVLMLAGPMTAQTFTTLHSFTATSRPFYTNSDGANPWAGMTLSGKTLYGTTPYGGSWGVGTVFKVNTDGTGFTNLHSFTAIGFDDSSGQFTNTDGGHPHAGLILSSNILYGTAEYYGPSGSGTVFAVNTDGTGFTNWHTFPGYPGDGDSPYAGLILSGNTLYGTTMEGGSWGVGTVFKVNTDGTGLTNLHSFTGGSDGGGLLAGLVLSGNALYGMADGSTNFAGTVFTVNTDGTGFTNLYSFTAFSGPFFPNGTNSDGAAPIGLILSGNTLYGTATYGGSSGNGTVFSLSFPPQLTIIPSEPYVILTWPTNYAGFSYARYTLQSTTNLGSSAVWTTNSPPPVVIGGDNVVINTISGKQQFYRLSQPLP